MSNKYIKLENLAYYDSNIKKYISNNIGAGNGVVIYDDYSQLPTGLTEDTIAYCKNDYIDNTSTMTYNKGLYFYNINNSTWELITINVDVDLSELEEALNKIDDVATQNDLKDYLDKDTYMSDVNKGNVKSADIANSIKGAELAKPYQFFGVDGAGESKFQYLPIQGDGQVTQGNFEQRQIVDAKANDVYEIGSVNGLDEYRIFVQAFKFKEGVKNIVSTVKEFNDSHKDSFYYNIENVDFVSDGCSIKNKYSFHVNLPKDGYFISNEINMDENIK